MSEQDLRGQDVGTSDLTQLMMQWNHIETQYRLLDQADARAQSTDVTLTARKLDIAQPCGIETYIIARGLIEASMDSLRTLRLLLTTHGSSPWAPWVLLRAVFEAAALANWVLEPDSGLQRRRRGLHRSWEDHRQWKAWQEQFAQEDAAAFRLFTDRVQQTTVKRKAEAAALGMAWQEVTNRLRLDQELPRLAVIRSMEMKPEFAVNLWRSLSGMTHGLPYAMVANTAGHGSRPIPGGERQIRAVDDTSWQAHSYLSSLLVLEAINLYIRRSNEAPDRQ